MRKLIFILVAGLLVPTSAWAQLQSYGVKAGGASAKVSGDGGSSDSMLGLSFGVFGEVPAGENLTIQPELLFSQKGYKYDAGSIDVTNTLSYIAVPVLVKMNLGQASAQARPFVFAGPEVGMLLSAKAKADGVSADIKDGFKSLDFGAVVGAGVGIGNISIDARYGLGLASIVDGGSGKNRAISLSVGYAFR